MKFSILGNAKGTTTKELSLDDDGKLIKKYPDPLTIGVVRHCEEDLCDLADTINQMKPEYCLVHGVAKETEPGEEVTVVTIAKQQREKNIARSKEFFEYSNEPHLAMLDIDQDKQCNLPFLDAGESLSALSSIDEQFDTLGHLVVPSSSEGLAIDGKPQKGGGYHLYFAAKAAHNLAEYMTAIFKLSIIEGHGWIKLSSSGSMLVRSCFDNAIYSPERIDFTAMPVISDPRITQDRPEPEYFEGGMLDCSQIPYVDEEKYQKVIAELKGLPATVKKADVLVRKRASKISEERDISFDDALVILKEQEAGDLYAHDIIEFQKFGGMSVKDILADPEIYDQEPCADPSEPEAGTNKAKFYFNNGEKPIIHSMLHGCKNYFLKGNLPVVFWDYDELIFYLEKVGESECSQAERGKFLDDLIAHTDRTDLYGWDSTRKKIKECLHCNMGTIDAAVVVATDSDGGLGGLGDDEDFRTHAELSLDFVSGIDKTKLISTEGRLWEYQDKHGVFIPKEIERLELRLGTQYSGSYCKKGGDYRAVAKLVYTYLFKKDFFQNLTYGLPGKDRFFSLKGGVVVAQDYTKELRQRVKLDLEPVRGECPMFKQYLEDSFQGEEQEEQIALLQEIMGGLVIGGFGRIQRVILLYGSGANGKSVFLELLSNLFPASMRCSISPSDFGNEYYRAELAGKVVNIVGELPQTKSLPSASFKDITGNDTEITGRQIYKSPFTFKPIAGHIFASNFFPQTKDHTIGFYRRWVVLDFCNKVPTAKRIPNLVALLIKKEGPQIIAWALDGAKRLVDNEFKLSLTTSHSRLMSEWQVKKDSVYSFIYDDEYIEHSPDLSTSRLEFYTCYRNYCSESGLVPIGKQNFYERCGTKLSSKRHLNKRCFSGVGILRKNWV